MANNKILRNRTNSMSNKNSFFFAIGWPFPRCALEEITNKIRRHQICIKSEKEVRKRKNEKEVRKRKNKKKKEVNQSEV